MDKQQDQATPVEPAVVPDVATEPHPTAHVAPPPEGDVLVDAERPTLDVMPEVGGEGRPSDTGG